MSLHKIYGYTISDYKQHMGEMYRTKHRDLGLYIVLPAGIHDRPVYRSAWRPRFLNHSTTRAGLLTPAMVSVLAIMFRL